ncbi:MAG: TolC family protein [Mangrovibacterium sp.]
MRNHKMTFMLFISLMVSLNTYSQQYLSLEEALESAKENNANIKITDLEERIAYATYRQTDAVFLPQVDVAYTALSTNNPLNAFGFLLNQASVTAADFDPSRLNHPGSVQDYGTKVEIRQPLINIDGYYARKGAKSQEEVYRYKAVRAKQYVNFEVKKAYGQLQFSYKAKEILENSLQDVKTIYRSTENFFRQGLIQQSDVLNAQVQVNTVEAALAKAESSILHASDEIALLMEVDKPESAFKTDSLTLLFVSSQKEDLSPARADIRALDKAIESASMMEKSSGMSFLPRLNAFGSWQLNASELFGSDDDSYLAGISLSWNLFSGNRNKSKLQTSRFQTSKLEEEKNLYVRKSQVELDKTWRDLHDIQTEITKYTTSVAQAKEALRILNNRYKEGLVSTTDLLAAQAQLSQQDLLRAKAILAYNLTGAYLSFLLEWDE